MAERSLLLRCISEEIARRPITAFQKNDAIHSHLIRICLPPHGTWAVECRILSRESWCGYFYSVYNKLIPFEKKRGKSIRWNRWNETSRRFFFSIVAVFTEGEKRSHASLVNVYHANTDCVNARAVDNTVSSVS